MKINPLTMIQAIFNAVAVAILTWLTKSSIGLACAMQPKLFGGPLPDNSVTSHGIMVGGGAIATATLFWPKIKPLIFPIIQRIIGGGGSSTPATPDAGTTPVIDLPDSLGDITSILGSLIGSDARLAPFKIGVDYLFKIPQFVVIVNAVKTYGWPEWWYVGVKLPGRPIMVAAAGILPEVLPAPSPPPKVIEVQPAVPAVVVNPPPVPVNVVHEAAPLVPPSV